MKTIKEFLIKEKRFYKPYSKQKKSNTTQIENDLKDKLLNKEISCSIKFDSENINLNILNNLREGIVGHIVEDVIISQIEILGIGGKIDKTSNNADLIINNEIWEVKAFNKQYKKDNVSVLKGISFSYRQTQDSEGYPIVFIQYDINNDNIIIKDIKCKYPDEITWSQGKSGRGTVVKLDI